MRVDLGPAKGSGPGGIITVKSTAKTTYSPGGNNLATATGRSLEELGVSAGMTLDIDIETPADTDGYYLLVAIKRQTR